MLLVKICVAGLEILTGRFTVLVSRKSLPLKTRYSRQLITKKGQRLLKQILSISQ